MRRTAIGAVLALLGVLACVGPAHAAPAGTRRIAVTVDRAALNSGASFTATATANVRCTWLIEWNGERRHRDARRFVTTFTAPAVTHRTRMYLQARCFYPFEQRARATGRSHTRHTRHTRARTDVQTLRVVVPPSWTHAVTIVVYPAGAVVNPPQGAGGGGHTPGLPNTGGPSSWVLLIGLVLLLSGAGAIRSSLREEPSLPASRG